MSSLNNVVSSFQMDFGIRNRSYKRDMEAIDVKRVWKVLEKKLWWTKQRSSDWKKRSHQRTKQRISQWGFA
uniref:Uncharacterized protein n=1 Tax=Manihot esculenta TaxID=3983 RepID=A0A2C9WFB5_MANES